MSITFEILKPIIDFVISFISTLGYPGIFLLSILESALIPIPSEIIMPFSGFLVSNGTFEPVSVVLAGTFGNLVGSILTYYLGIKAGRAFILRKVILNLPKSCSRNMVIKFHSFVDCYLQYEHIYLFRAASVKLILLNSQSTHF